MMVAVAHKPIGGPRCLPIAESYHLEKPYRQYCGRAAFAALERG